MGFRFLKSFLRTFGFRIVILLIIITTVILSTGCNGNKSKDQGPSAERQSAKTEKQSGEGKDSETSGEIPMELEKLEKDIEEIMKILNGPVAASEEEKDKGSEQQDKGKSESKQDDSGKGKEENQDKESEQEDRKKQEDDQEKGGEQGNEQENKEQKDQKQGQGEEKDQQKHEGQQENKGQQEQGKENEAQQPDEKNPWQDITPVIDKLHFTWNSYEPKAAKIEDSQDKLSAFSDALNELTNSIQSKNKTSTLVNANKCYGEIAKLYSIYKKPNVSEVKKLKYYTRNVILSSMENDRTSVDENMEQIKAIWDVLKSNLSEDNKEASDTLDFSIKELEKVIKEEKQNLVDLKGRIVLTNIEDIDKKLSGDQ